MPSIVVYFKEFPCLIDQDNEKIIICTNEGIFYCYKICKKSDNLLLIEAKTYFKNKFGNKFNNDNIIIKKFTWDELGVSFTEETKRLIDQSGLKLKFSKFESKTPTLPRIETPIIPMVNKIKHAIGHSVILPTLNMSTLDMSLPIFNTDRLNIPIIYLPLNLKSNKTIIKDVNILSRINKELSSVIDINDDSNDLDDVNMNKNISLKYVNEELDEIKDVIIIREKMRERYKGKDLIYQTIFGPSFIINDIFNNFMILKLTKK
jgi:hypothetical protein